MINTLWLKLGAVVTLILGLVAAFFKIKSMGAAEEVAKRNAERLKAVQTKKETDDAVENLGAADVDRELARWMRDDSKG